MITVKEQHFVVQLSQKQSNGTFLLDKNTPLDYFISEGRIYMGNKKTDWMIYSDREMSVMSAQEEKVSFKELIKSLGMTQKEFSETFGIPMGTLRHWISGDRECPVYTKRMLAYMGIRSGRTDQI